MDYHGLGSSRSVSAQFWNLFAVMVKTKKVAAKVEAPKVETESKPTELDGKNPETKKPNASNPTLKQRAGKTSARKMSEAEKACETYQTHANLQRERDARGYTHAATRALPVDCSTSPQALMWFRCTPVTRDFS